MWRLVYLILVSAGLTWATNRLGSLVENSHHVVETENSSRLKRAVLPQTLFSELPQCVVTIKSWGYDEEVTSGYIALNGEEVITTSQNLALDDVTDTSHRRGVSIVVINPTTCTVRQTRNWDTYGSSAAARDMKSFILGLNRGDIVAIATSDTVEQKPPSHVRLFNDVTMSSLGVDFSLVEFRGKLVAVAMIGNPRRSLAKVENHLPVDHPYQPTEIAVIVPRNAHEQGNGESCTLALQSWGYNEQVKSGYIALNGEEVVRSSQYLELEHVTVTYHRRGVSIAVINPTTCTVSQTRNWDTYSSSAAARDLRSFILGINIGDIVAITTSDTVDRKSPSHVRLFNDVSVASLGVDFAQLPFRGKLVAAAVKGHPMQAQVKVESKLPVDHACCPTELAVQVDNTRRTLYSIL